MTIEAMKQALEALEAYRPVIVKRHGLTYSVGDKAITSLRQAIEQAQVASIDTSQERVDETAKQRHEQAEKQEPVAHTLNCVCGAVWDISLDGAEEMVHTPDSTPPPRQPLLASDIVTMYDENPRSDSEMISFARAIEQAHQIYEVKK